MIRLLGAITGAALALATLLVVIGIPQFKAETSEIDRRVMTLPLPTSPVEETEAPAPEVAQTTIAATTAAEPETELADLPIDDVDVEAVSLETSFDPVEMEQVGELETAAPEPIAPPSIPALDVQNWYAFWSPFRSEIAASGFVEQLQRVTGLDYRVVKVKPGVYEVAFAYSDDTDISHSLSQITAATGLQMPEY